MKKFTGRALLIGFSFVVGLYTTFVVQRFGIGSSCRPSMFLKSVLGASPQRKDFSTGCGTRVKITPVLCTLSEPPTSVYATMTPEAFK